ncbi:MAG TPA: ParB/RepB/Spo0J family partition protein [Vicinamibacterales bacterium]|nr:ParB/RepB/Spo0J family partition protein [Vicinamibacterales bacterium]
MRHDEHYVEALTASAGAPIGRLVPIEQIDPNPSQPRQMMGDLTELIASITEKGILEPLIVRQHGDRYEIIAGERRYQAAVQAGLPELPVIVREADDHEVIELALIENLQRKDLTAFEEADALQALAAACSYTHEDLARRLSRSRVAVTESLSLAKMPEEIRNLCRLADISSKSLLLEIVRQGDTRKMHALVEKIASGQSVTREQVRRETASPKSATRARPFVFQYKAPTRAFSFQLRFRKGTVEREEIISTLEDILQDLRNAS